MSSLRCLFGVVASSTLATTALEVHAGVVSVIDFEGPVHGTILSNQFASQGLANISAVNPNRSFDLAAIFDTTRTGTADPDLEDPWDGGNLPSDLILRNLVIIAENNTGAGDGVLDNPDDEGNRPAGTLFFDFSRPVTFFGFDVVDIEGVIQESSRVEFFAGGSSVGSVTFAQFVTFGSPYFDPTVVFGDNFANRIRPIPASDFGADGFDRVAVHLGGSAGIDNLIIPAPGAGLALLAGLALTRRRR
ncbi:MAG: hypothetical protein ACK4WH_10950 [Phycisphaerales bacterium]